ncbi:MULTISPECIES: hypothetical protein [unclassified Pseudoalteromonas]|uniref:hypothetical protein n=1 Tax=unclassified Pseudoalteromonas TaxID=194690 RepID=UPI001EFD3E62|nr:MULTISPECIES: hypothetical protein [unclassified Pseudoalteromonas]MCG9760209.1 hypothetical protein [Pseudoalteromonas sp. Isolate6]
MADAEYLHNLQTSLQQHSEASLCCLPSPNRMITISATSMDSPAACAVIMMRNGNPSTDGKTPNDPDGNVDSIVHL